jgi:REP element-mobilizing transposase RayT
MPQLSRADQIEESLTYHVYNRGNGKLDVFHDDQDCQRFLQVVSKYKSLYPIAIYHWVLMSNHFHIVISMEIPKLISKCIGGILQVYAQYHHKRWDSAGRLWQGRFASQVVQKEKYLFECGRYVERNPMRAGLVKYPWEYKWSSCQYYINTKKDDIITRDPAFEAFGNNAQDGIEKYKEWLMEGEETAFYNLNNPVGDKEFIRRLTQDRGRLVRRKKGRPARKA